MEAVSLSGFPSTSEQKDVTRICSGFASCGRKLFIPGRGPARRQATAGRRAFPNMSCPGKDRSLVVVLVVLLLST
ncbi:MAG: hypothetical protein ACR2M4_05115, partial [Actinomycetota bacterium]